MRSTLKARLKAGLVKAGLLAPALAIQARVNRAEARNAATAFRFYLYNHWLTDFPSHNVRLLYLRRVLGVRVGRGSYVHMSCFFEGDKISIGDNSVIGRGCFLGGNGGALVIKNNVSITARAYMFCASHVVDSPDFASVYGDIVIEDRAWIGAGATIMPGVRVGEGAVLGAVAAATKDIPDHAIWAGVPARPIGTRNRELTYTLKYWAYFS